MFVLDVENFILLHIQKQGTTPQKPTIDMWNFIVQACYTTYLQGMYDEAFQMVYGIPVMEAEPLDDLPEDGWNPYV